jgi:glyoxylase-like metal-dependent hydrolase (beta-lactamase superfamily II)
MDEIELGDVSVTRIEEMHGPLGISPQELTPGVPDQVWQRHAAELIPDHVADGIAIVAMQSWLVRSEGRTILVDTGVGNDKPRPALPALDHLAQPAYLDNLRRAGVEPADVDVVINTHLHIDHVGWNTRLQDGGWIPTFPNATYLLPKADFEFWDPANNPDIPDIAGGGNVNVFEDSVAPVRDAGQVRLWEESYRVDANLVLEAAPGHTPGSSVIKLFSGGKAALFAGDLMHSPVQVTEPDASSCFCSDPAASRTTRRRLLGWAADTGALVLPAHFCGRSAIEVQRVPGAFAISRWAPFSQYAPVMTRD